VISALKRILGHEIHRNVEKVVDKAVDKVPKSPSASIFYLIAYIIGKKIS
jgi:hypothetical protein